MKYLIWICIFLLIGTLVALQIELDNGYVLVVFQGYSIETSIWFLLFCIFVFVFIFWLILQLIQSVFYSKNLFNKGIQFLSNRNQQNIMHKIVTAFLLEDFETKDKYIKQLDTAILPTSIITLARIQGFIQAQKYQLAEIHINKAYKTYAKKNEIIESIKILEFQLEFARKNYADAIGLFQKLNKKSKVRPNLHMLFLRALFFNETFNVFYVYLHKKFSGTTKELQPIFDLVMQNKNIEIDAQTFWEKLPKELQNKQENISQFAQYLFDRQLYQTLDTYLLKQKSILLTHFLGRYLHINGDKILHCYENISTNIDDAEYLTGLGLLCMQLKLWGKALKYFSSSLQIHPEQQEAILATIKIYNLTKQQDKLESYIRSL